MLTGAGLGITHTSQKQLKVLKEAKRIWRKINEKVLKEKIRELYRTKLIKAIENPDKSWTLILTDKGKIRALTYHFQKIEIKPVKWDGKWRTVLFDIPDRLKRRRDALREKLKELGFYELQESVFVFPYECQKEIEFIIEFFNLRSYVRYGVLEKIDNELHLKKIFKLI